MEQQQAPTIAVPPLIHELKGAVSDEIVRRANQQAAIEAMITEQQQRIQTVRMLEVMDALLASTRRAAVARAERTEQIARVAEATWTTNVLPELASVSARKTAATATEAERKRRIEEHPHPAQIHTPLRSALNETIAQTGAAAAARDDADTARAERVHAHRMADVCDDIARAVARADARAAAETERAERIAVDRLHAVCEELRRAPAAVVAARAVEAERAEQLASSSNADDAAAVTRYYGDAVVAEAKAAVTEAIARIGNRNDAIAVAEAERANREIRNAMLTVCEQLERTAARRDAVAAAEAERDRRVTDTARREVCAELRSAAARQHAATAAATEQEWRAQSGIDRTYWVVDPATIAEAKHDINAAIATRGSGMVVREAAELERTRRLHNTAMDAICDDVRRTVARREAREQAELERAQRIAMDRLHDVCGEVRRTANVRSAITAAETERTRRVSTEIPHPQQQPGDAVADTKAPVHEDLIRLANRRAAIEAMVGEQAERIQQDRMYEVCDELTRKVAQREARTAADTAREIAVTELRMQDVFSSILKQQAPATANHHGDELRQARIAMLAEIMAPRAC